MFTRFLFPYVRLAAGVICLLLAAWIAVLLVAGALAETIPVLFAQADTGAVARAASWTALGAGTATLAHCVIANFRRRRRSRHRSDALEIRRLEEAMRRLKRRSTVLRTLLARHERDSEAERKRLSWEVHEELGQTLAAMRINLEVLAAGRLDPHPHDRLESSKELLDHAIRRVRKLSASLRPRVLDLDVAASLEWLADDFMLRTRIPCLLDIDVAAGAMEEECRTMAFRIAQDALDNVECHAEAQTVDLTLRRVSGCYFLRIQDDGKGFVVHAVRGGCGLLRMRERARMLGGELRIFSSPGKGTVVDVFLPDAAPHDASAACDFPLSDRQ